MRALHAEGVPQAPQAPTGSERHAVPDAWLTPGWGGQATLTDHGRAAFRAALADLRRRRESALARREWDTARRLQRLELALRRDWRPTA